MTQLHMESHTDSLEADLLNSGQLPNESLGRQIERMHPEEARVYLEFANSAERDRALEFLRKKMQDEASQFEDLFRYLKIAQADKGRESSSDGSRGIELGFTKEQENLVQKLHDYLAQNGFTPTEGYETIGGEPAGAESRQWVN